MGEPTEHWCEWRHRAELLEARIAQLETQLQALQRATFGNKSEKQSRASKLTPPVDPEQTKQKRQENAEAKQALPESRIHRPVPDDLKACPNCGGQASRPLPPKTSEQWEQVAGHFEHPVHLDLAETFPTAANGRVGDAARVAASWQSGWLPEQTNGRPEVRSGQPATATSALVSAQARLA